MSWLRNGVLDHSTIRQRYPFAGLVRPQVGLVERVTFLPQRIGSPIFEVASTSLGNLSMAFAHVRDRDGADVRDRVLGGGGSDIEAELAWVRSVVESAERYATMVCDPRDFKIATAAELGDTALDLGRIPRCSEREYADPKCPLRAASVNEPIRWVRGYSLVSKTEKFVPAIMTHLYLTPWPAERFWLPISTGVAAHTNLAAGLVSAICETIERDAIALTWLARLPLAHIEMPDHAQGNLAPLLDRLARSRVIQHFFDATTDVGVPTVFSVQLSPHDPGCELLVSCATALDASTACAKAIREAAPTRNVMSRGRSIPGAIEDFCELTHGADYYSKGGHLPDFDFLLKGCTTTDLNSMADGLPAQPRDEEALALLVGRLKQLGMEAVAIDLTTEELRAVGLWVVRVVIPELVPISFVHRARYLGTERIYDYARRFGSQQFTEQDINPGPMPFA